MFERKAILAVCIFHPSTDLLTFQKIVWGTFFYFLSFFSLFHTVFIAFSILDAAISIYFSSLYMMEYPTTYKATRKECGTEEQCWQFCGSIDFRFLDCKRLSFLTFFCHSLIELISKKLKAGKVFLVMSPFLRRVLAVTFGGLGRREWKVALIY